MAKPGSKKSKNATFTPRPATSSHVLKFCLYHLLDEARENVRTELQHPVEKAYGRKLVVPADTRSLDEFWDDTLALLRSYGHVIVIVVLAYVLFLAFRYITSINSRLEAIEGSMRILLSLHPHNQSHPKL